MSTVLWIVLVGGAFVGGVSIVTSLVTQRSREPFTATIGVVAVGSCAWAFGRLASAYANVDALVYAFGLAIGAFGGGYALASALLDRLSRTPHPTVPDARHPLTGTRVLLLACSEPEAYDPRATSRELGRLADEGLIDLSIGVTPFMYAAQKARYRAIGGKSPARAQARQLAEALEPLLEGRCDSVVPASCDGPDSLVARSVEAIEAGRARIVVALASVGESAEMMNAKRAVDRLRPGEHGIEVAYTAPLWSAEPVLGVLVARIMAAIEDLEASGVALVAHGQPTSRETTHAAFDSEENAFASRVRMMLVDGGLLESHVRVAWAEWREPDVSTTVRHLGALGCKRIVVAPACFPFDDLVTRLDVPLGVRQARLDASTSVVTLNAWSDDPAIPEALARTIAATCEEVRGPV